MIVNPVAKALWFIESHSSQDLTLDDIARCAGVSRFHLLRAFAAVTGRPIMRFLRGRRLSDAAVRLAAGADDILTVAIDAGYGSHEAFTRAFREQFGVTPESVRRQGHLDNLPLLERISMNDLPNVPIAPPRFERSELRLIAGLAERYHCETCGAGIPALWQRFGAYLGHIKGQIDAMAYGVTYNHDDAGNMDYLAGAEVVDFSALPPEFTRLRIPAHRYAVFTHHEHISSIRSTLSVIWTTWLPQSGERPVDAPCFERYTETFNPHTGAGGVEIWIPVSH